MTKAFKIIAILFVAFTLVFSVAQPTMVYADTKSITENIKNEDSNSTSEMTKIASKITGFIWVLSIIVAVIVVMYTGLKFIVGSANEKAEYKKSLVPIVVGVLLLVFATTIINALFSINS